MSLIFDIEKDKKIAMMVETSGIESPDKLDFTFNITVDGVRYGFPCELKEGKVEISIPPLNTIISKVKAGKYMASLDVTGDKNYFLQPFNEEIMLKREPKVDVIVDDENNTTMKEAITASISKIIDIEDSPSDEKDVTKDVNEDVDDISSNEKAPIKKSAIDKMFG